MHLILLLQVMFTWLSLHICYRLFMLFCTHIMYFFSCSYYKSFERYVFSPSIFQFHVTFLFQVRKFFSYYAFKYVLQSQTFWGVSFPIKLGSPVGAQTLCSFGKAYLVVIIFPVVDYSPREVGLDHLMSDIGVL